MEELSKEQVEEIRALAEHPGWVEYRGLLEQLRNARSREVARLLRECNSNSQAMANYYQGYIDGVMDALKVVEEPSEPPQGIAPAY